MIKFRNLKPDEIEVRVQSVKQTGLILLLYKDARCDQNILDETVGIFGWSRQHEVINGSLFCTVYIRDPETNEWVSKQDVGTESNTEKEKGQASDSFKRACFNWGIGRELYTSPFIWIPASKTKIEGNRCTDAFAVSAIRIKNKKIVGLTIISTKTGRTVYDMGDTSTEPSTMDNTDEQQVTQIRKCSPQQVKLLKQAYTGDNLEKLLKSCKVSCIEDIPLTKASDLLFRLKEKGMI